MFAHAIVLSLSAALAQSAPVRTELALKPNGMQFRLRSPVPQRILLAAQPPSAAKGAVAKAGWLWGALPFGPAGHAPTVVALDETEPPAQRLHIDSDGNGNPLDDPPADWKSLDADSDSSARFEGTIEVPLATPARPRVRLVAYRFQAAAAKTRGVSPGTLFYYRDYALEGHVEIEGQSHHVAVCDEDTTGDFAHPTRAGGNLAIGIDINNDGEFTGLGEWIDAGSPVNVGKLRLLLKSLNTDGSGAEFRALSADLRMAPAFSGPDLSGKTIRFPQDFKGKLVLVDFWATWCMPCRAEVPNVVAAVKQYKDNPQFEVLSVSLDNPGSQKAVSQFVSNSGMNWKHIVEGKGWSSEISRLFAVSSIPRVFLIDADTQTIVAEGPTLRGAELPKTIGMHLLRRRG